MRVTTRNVQKKAYFSFYSAGWKSASNQRRKGEYDVAQHHKGADSDQVELVKKSQVQTTLLHETFVCMQNENSSEDKAEHQSVQVNQGNSMSSHDEQAAEGCPVL
jgi:hypothetical protein